MTPEIGFERIHRFWQFLAADPSGQAALGCTGI
jgi:hypothetical protein